MYGSHQIESVHIWKSIDRDSSSCTFIAHNPLSLVHRKRICNLYTNLFLYFWEYTRIDAIDNFFIRNGIGKALYKRKQFIHMDGCKVEQGTFYAPGMEQKVGHEHSDVAEIEVNLILVKLWVQSIKKEFP